MERGRRNPTRERERSGEQNRDSHGADNPNRARKEAAPSRARKEAAQNRDRHGAVFLVPPPSPKIALIF